MLAVSESRWLHGRRLWLPTDEQIRLALRALSVPEAHRDTSTAGAWAQALKLAGLESEPQRTPAVVASSTVELLERCFAAHGTEPSALELRRFARANRIPWTPDRHRSWLESLAAWKDTRRAQGLHVPTGPPPRTERPAYSRDVGAARAGERRRADWTSLDACVEHVLAYLEQLPPGGRSTKKSYNDWALAAPGRPAYSAFGQHGGWGRLRRIAHARMLRSEDS